MSQIGTTLSKCNVLTFSWPNSVIDIRTSSFLVSEGAAFSSGKPLGQKYFDWLCQGRKWRVSAGEGTAVDFCSSRSAPSISGSVGLKWSWEWDMNSHTARNTLLQSYRIPLICSALHSAVGLTLAVTQRSSGIIPPLWEKKSWWSPALLGLGAADLARQCVPAHFMPYRRNI